MLIRGLEKRLMRGDFVKTVYGPGGRVEVFNGFGCWIWYQCADCGRVYNTIKMKEQCTRNHEKQTRAQLSSKKIPPSTERTR